MLQERGIYYSRSEDERLYFCKFAYRSFYNGKEVKGRTEIWCKNLGEFLSLLFYWSGEKWIYKPCVDKYGYIEGSF